MNTTILRSAIDQEISDLRRQYADKEMASRQQHTALCATNEAMDNLGRQIKALVRTLEGLTDYEELQP